MIQSVQQLQQLLLGGFVREMIHGAVNAALLTILLLIAYIDLGGGVLPHQHHCHARPAALCSQLLYLLADGFLALCRQRLSV